MTWRSSADVGSSSIVERLIAAVLAAAERHVANQLTGGLTAVQSEALEALLAAKPDTATSVLAWTRLPPGAPGHTALKRLAEQLACLRAVGLDPACADGVHAERLRKLAREGARFTAQHLRALSPLRRRAILVATVLDTTARLTDDGVALFDRAVGRMYRRAEVREEDAVLRDARANNDKVRLLAKLGAALVKAKASGTELDGAVATAVGWEKLAASVAEAERLARPDKADLPALAARAWPVLHWLGPVFLDAFKLRAVSAAASTLRAAALLHDAYRSGGRTWPQSLPVRWNTVDLGRALDALRCLGKVVPDALPAHIAPLGWQHINLTGDYLWDADAAIGPNGFRPLRGDEAPVAGDPRPGEGGFTPITPTPSQPGFDPAPPSPNVLPGRPAEEQGAAILQQDRNDGLAGGARTNSQRAREAARAADPAVTQALPDADWRAHHLINVAGLRVAPELIAAAAQAGWRTDDPGNVAALPASPDAQQKLKAAGIDRPVHDSGHRNWNAEVEKRLRTIAQELRDEGRSPGTEAYRQQARKTLEKLQNDLRQQMMQQDRLTQNMVEGRIASA